MGKRLAGWERKNDEREFSCILWDALNPQSRNRRIIIYSFTYSLSFVQQIFLSINGTMSYAKKRRVKMTQVVTALGSYHMKEMVIKLIITHIMV